MAVNTRYYPGGLNTSAPARNRAEEWDGTAGTYTAWNQAGVVTSTRSLTAAEVADLAALDAVGVAAANDKTIRGRAQQALAANATYLAIASPTNAQVAAQVEKLTKECTAVIRLLLGQLDTTDGT